MVPVSISYGIQTIKTLEDSLKKLGGIHQFIQKGQTIFIKPDLTLPLGPPIIIQPQVLGHVLKLCHDAGAKKVYIGFNPFNGTCSKQLLKLLGLDYYLEDLNGTLLNIEDEKFSPVNIPNPIIFDTLFIPEKLQNSDVFISLVAPRTDIYGGYALGLKNYFGLLTDEQKQHLIKTGSLQGLLDYYQIKPPDLTIWDAMVVGAGQGPFNQKAVPYNLILSATDLIAGESVMAQLMGINPQLLETRNSNTVTIIGEEITKHQKIIKKPIVSSKNLSQELEIIEGKPCPGCQICLRYFLDLLFRFIEKDLKEFGGLSLFIGELSPDLTYSLKTGIILFGNCAITSNLQINFHNKNQMKKQFFKFPGCPPLKLRSIEKFCLQFKEWLPSLEIVEEFVRKWTLGRQYKNQQTSPMKKE